MINIAKSPLTIGSKIALIYDQYLIFMLFSSVNPSPVKFTNYYITFHYKVTTNVFIIYHLMCVIIELKHIKVI